MDNIIKAWKGWRLEFEEEYGSDMDGATEYSSYSTFDWTIDLAEIIETNMMGWLTFKLSGYDNIYLEEVTEESIKVHFTTGYAITLSHAKPSYRYSYQFGHGDYTHTIRLLTPWEKQDEIAKYKEVYCRRKCLLKLKPDDVAVPENIEPVDLGLNVDWAPFNLGATSPDELGNEFAWSETEPGKKGYAYIRGLNDENGKPMYNERGNSLYEYSGMKKYDAAAVFWGDGWRTPSKEEVYELLYNCKWSRKKENGREGYVVTGKNGKSIFIPINEEYRNWEGRSGSSCWSSSGYMMPGGSTKGYTLSLCSFIKGDHYNYSCSDSSTDTTLYIRPVRDKK